MSKRRATDELYGDCTKRQEHPSRREEFTANLRALNNSFAQWVQQQAAQAGDQLWLAAVKDYASHAEKLLEDFDDVLLNGKQHRSIPPLANNLFGTPAAANGPAHTLPGSLSAGASGAGKSVTFASGSTTFSTPGRSEAAAGTATAATPGTSNATDAGHTPAPGTSNTANAGHTPAPASGLSFHFAATPGGTPGSASELPSPQMFKLGASETTPGSAGDHGATPSPAPSSVFTFGNGSGAAAADTPASTAGFGTPVPTPGGAKAFTFGASSSSTPAGQDSIAAAGASSSGVAFSFGATSAAGSSGAGAATAGSTGGFSFGATPAGSGSTPAFSFSTGAGGSSTSGGFNFPAPAAAGAADAAAANEVEEGDEPPKHKLELKVDEDKWKVLFSSKAKLHLLVNGSEWSGRGVGMLTMRQPKDDEGKTYIVFSTEGGKQLVASPLMGNTKVTQVERTPSRCRMLLLVPQYQLPPSGTKADAAAVATPKADYQLQGCMFSFGTEEKVKQFARLVDEHKPAATDK